MSRAALLLTRHDDSIPVTNEASKLQIDVSTEGGNTYYQTTVRQTSYTLHQNKQGDWEVWSKRKNMATMGQIRFFDDLESLEKEVKSLRGIAAYIANLSDDLEESLVSTPALDEAALDHDSDDSYEAALALLHTLAKANGYRKGAKALADTMEVGKYSPIELAELVDYFESMNDHNMAGIATAMKRERPDWVLVVMTELEKLQAKSDGVSEAFTRLRVAVLATASMTKSMTADLKAVKLDSDLASIVNSIPAKDRKGIVVNWKFEF